MAPAIKNRLVGTIIIVALAVIFLPDMLNGEKQTRRDIVVNIPSSPESISLKMPATISSEQIKQKALPAIKIDDSKADDDQIAVYDEQPSTNKTNKSTTLTSKEKMNPVSSLEQQTFIQQPNSEEATGWVIQLGSFKHQKNVRELMDKVEKAGYRVFSQPVQTSVGRLNKVFVGPELDKSRLEKALSHLQEITNLTGRITPFSVK